MERTAISLTLGPGDLHTALISALSVNKSVPLLEDKPVSVSVL